MSSVANKLFELCEQIDSVSIDLDGDEYFNEKGEIVIGKILAIRSYLEEYNQVNIVTKIDSLDLESHNLIQIIEFTRGYLIPVIRETFENMVEENFERNELFWEFIHPRIKNVSLSRYNSGHFADSVESAMKEINSAVKMIVKSVTGDELDGVKLMDRAFSMENPIIKLNDLSSESDKNIQKGYMQIFQGSMTGIRNPKAHENMNTKRNKAIHLLFLSSLLMYKIDERIP
jgi:uncharacterized protein (TIGR02391 family)